MITAVWVEGALLCRSVLVDGAAAAQCACRDPYIGPFCSITRGCNGTVFTAPDGSSQCCPSGRFVSGDGSCCPPGFILDVSGACCAAAGLDACGVCGGTGGGSDRSGRCCAGHLTEDLLCCPQPLDRCGACGDGTSCNAEVVLLLRGVSDSVHATIIDTTRSLLCGTLGYGTGEACPLSVSPGSGVLPASRQLRLREKQRGMFSMRGGHHSRGSAGRQAVDVGVRVLQAWGASRGAVAVPAAAMAPPALWVQWEGASRRMLDTGSDAADVLELAVCSHPRWAETGTHKQPCFAVRGRLI